MRSPQPHSNDSSRLLREHSPLGCFSSPLKLFKDPIPGPTELLSLVQCHFCLIKGREEICIFTALLGSIQKTRASLLHSYILKLTKGSIVLLKLLLMGLDVRRCHIPDQTRFVLLSIYSFFFPKCKRFLSTIQWTEKSLYPCNLPTRLSHIWTSDFEAQKLKINILFLFSKVICDTSPSPNPLAIR